MVAVVAGYAMHVTIAVSGLLLALIDQREHRLPNRGTYPTAVLLGLLALIHNDSDRLTGAVVAGAGSAAFFWLLAVLPTEPLGLGDVKLQAVVGFYLGWWFPPLVFVQVCGAFIVAGLVAVWLVGTKRGGYSDPIAFGPAMVAATWLAMAWWKSWEII
jgi:leader peptidase (prepilin peptidase)/N-methyltransferase